MRRWLGAPLLFAAAIGLTALTQSHQAVAQAKADPPVEETFQTADGVQIHGLFHKSAKDPGSAPVVILLYPPGKDNNMSKGDWEGLANRLTEAGYHVYRFDWRGHGKSTDIKKPDVFWGNPYTGPWNNKYIKGAGIKPLKNTLFFKDLTDPGRYIPVYLNDLAAVRAQLDSKNDAGDLSTSSVYLIGAGDAASLGFAWLAAEWNRPQFYPKQGQLGLGVPRYEFVPQPLVGGINAEAGPDVAAAVWLSGSRPMSIPQPLVQGWVSGAVMGQTLRINPPKFRENTPMLFLYADKDAKGKASAEFFHHVALVAQGDKKLEISPLERQDKLLKELKGANALQGVQLLGNNDRLQTEDTILKFLDAIQKDRAKLTRKNRDYSVPYFIRLTDFGFMP